MKPKPLLARSNLDAVLRRAGSVPMVLMALVLFGCDSPTEGSSTEEAQVAVGMSVVSSEGALPDGELVVSGTNGSLRIMHIDMVVDEIELEGIRGTEDFEDGPLFLALTMDGSSVPIVSTNVPAGRFDELQFEVDDFDDDDAGDLFAEVRLVHAEWPEEASMRVEGVFDPAEGELRPFVVYIEAELEIELDLEPALIVEENDMETLLVTLSPGHWFMRGDGRVVDLSDWNHLGGDDLLELEIDIEDGFLSVEWDD